jgi:hypothetical protein
LVNGCGHVAIGAAGFELCHRLQIIHSNALQSFEAFRRYVKAGVSIAKASLIGMDYMRPGEKAGLATPADHRRRRRKSIIVFVLFLIAVVGVLAATVLSVNDGRNYERLVRQYGLQKYFPLATTPKTIRIDRRRQLPLKGIYPPWLLRQNLELAATFQRPAPSTAEERCFKLKTDSSKDAGFSSSGNDWECILEEEFGSASERASLFIQARGALPDTLRTFRMKLSLIDPAQERAMLRATVDAIDRFGLMLTPESRAYLAERLAARVEFTSALENYRMTFSREMTDDRRFNLLILPRPATSNCGTAPSTLPDRFGAPRYVMSIACLPLRSGKAFPPSG